MSPPKYTQICPHPATSTGSFSLSQTMELPFPWSPSFPVRPPHPRGPILLGINPPAFPWLPDSCDLPSRPPYEPTSLHPGFCAPNTPAFFPFLQGAGQFLYLGHCPPGFLQHTVPLLLGLCATVTPQRQRPPILLHIALVIHLE